MLNRLLAAVFAVLLALSLCGCVHQFANVPNQTPSSGGFTGNGGGGGGGGATPTEFVYVADAVSSQISAYGVDPSTGALLPVPGAPFTILHSPAVSTGPMSLAVFQDILFVGGSDPTTCCGITSFVINKTNGSLTRIPDPRPMSSTDAAVGAINWPVVVADPTHGVVFASGSDQHRLPGFPAAGVASFKINFDGTLTEFGTAATVGASNGTLAVDPLGRFLYDWFNGQILQIIPLNPDGSLNPATAGSLTVSTVPPPPATSANACANAIRLGQTIVPNPQGPFVYLSCAGNDALDVVTVNSPTSASVLQRVAQNGLNGEISALTINPTGRFLFGTVEEQDTVAGFAVGTDGRAQPASAGPTDLRPNSVALDDSGKFVYVTNGSSNIFPGNNEPGRGSVSAFPFQTSGQMPILPGSPFPAGTAPRWIVVVTP